MKSAVNLKILGNIGVIEFDNPDSKVNVLSTPVMQYFSSILDDVAKDQNLKALLIVSKKKDIFIAGADIKEIEGIREENEGAEKSRMGQKIFDKLEDLKIPSIAVIDGVALGGGCELILACRYRVATFSDKVRIGLPEVNLGIIPGFGGTYRMPRVLGLSQGLQMVVSGKIISSKDALRFGLVDRLFPQSGLDGRVLKFASEVMGKARSAIVRKKKKKLPEKFLENTWPGQRILFKETRKAILKNTKGFYPAPLKAVDVIEQSIYLKRERALALEAQEFSKLAVTDTSKNLVKVFYLTEKYKKLIVPGTENIKPQPIYRSAVLGAGVMGGGIAQLLSYKGIGVRLKDVNYDAIAKGFKAAKKIYDQAVKRKRIKKFEADQKMGLITGTLDYSGFKSTDIVIEAVVENMEVKKKVFKELSERVNPKAVLCTNTSALSVSEMAREAKDTSKVIGLHFFNPVNRMPLIEIVTTPFVSPETVAAAVGLVKNLGKTPIVVKDSCGFLVNRILLGYINEAGRILEETGQMGQIDKLATRFGLPMGPFELSDEVGLDVGIKVLHILEKGLGGRFKPVEVFEKVLQKGLLGKKIGRGFYVHGKKISVNPDAPALLPGGPKKPFN